MCSIHYNFVTMVFCGMCIMISFLENKKEKENLLFFEINEESIFSCSPPPHFRKIELKRLTKSNNMV